MEPRAKPSAGSKPSVGTWGLFPEYQRPFIEGVVRKIAGGTAQVEGSIEEVAEIVDHAEQDRAFDEAR
jgi:hypothetical protein